MRANGASHDSGFQLVLSGRLVRTTCLEYWSSSTTAAANKYTRTEFRTLFNMSLPCAGCRPYTRGALYPKRAEICRRACLTTAIRTGSIAFRRLFSLSQGSVMAHTGHEGIVIVGC